MNFETTSIGAISFMATGIMYVIMASGESIRLHENEGHMFEKFVYSDEFGRQSSSTSIPESEYESLKLKELRHPNRHDKIEKNFSWVGFGRKEHKDFRRKQNNKARRSS